MAWKNLILAAVPAALAACEGNVDNTRGTQTVPAESVAERNRETDSATGAWAVGPARDYLECSPRNVGPDSVLVLRMQTPHGSSLYVGGPGRTLYLVVFHGEGRPDRGARRSLMSPEAFSKLTELRLNLRTLTGGVWIFGRDTNEVVFRERGAYRVRVGNDMETDGPEYAECLVTFDPQW